MSETETKKADPEREILMALYKAEGAYGRVRVASHALFSLWEELEPDGDASWAQHKELFAIWDIMDDLDEELGAPLKLAIEYFKEKTRR